MNKKYIVIIAIVATILILTGILIAVVLIQKNSKQKVLETASITKTMIKEEEAVEKLPEEEIPENEILENEESQEIKKDQKNSTKKQTTNKTNTKQTMPASTKPVASNGKPYYIKVNYGANVVTIYGLDDEGNYTVPVKAMICSTGKSTPRSGKYKIGSRWEWLRLLGGVYGHYTTQITGNILFHSVPYLRKSPDSLEYWEYDKLRNKLLSGMCKT